MQYNVFKVNLTFDYGYGVTFRIEIIQGVGYLQL